MMQILVQAARGSSSSNTFTDMVSVGGKLATARLDTVSTHTFMDLRFSTKVQCSTVLNCLENFKVAGGGELKTGSHVNHSRTPFHQLLENSAANYFG
jgi:hypothetical protein